MVLFVMCILVPILFCLSVFSHTNFAANAPLPTHKDEIDGGSRWFAGTGTVGILHFLRAMPITAQAYGGGIESLASLVADETQAIKKDVSIGILWAMLMLFIINMFIVFTVSSMHPNIYATSQMDLPLNYGFVFAWNVPT
jgi:amino acid transporter